jgi:hypothetical protein
MDGSVSENSSLRQKRPPLLLAGLDSLYVSFYLAVRASRLDFAELAFRKEQLKHLHNSDFAEVELGSERFALKPYGRHPYAYLLANEAFEVRLGENLRPACHVQFLSEGLWLHGLDHLLARFHTWRDSLRLTQTRPEVVARADWAFDYHLSEIDFTTTWFVSRATKDATHRDNQTEQTFQFGRGEVVFRVYDKVAEIEQKSSKVWFFDLWGMKNGVWRIEPQVRGPRLKSAGIHSIADLKALQNDLLREVATHHTTLRKPSRDPNRSRWPLHSLWQAFRDDIAALPQTGLVRAIDPRLPIEWRLFHQGRSLCGALKGLGAVLALRDGVAPPTLDGVLNALPGVLQGHHNSHLWQEDLKRRIAAYRLGQW